MPIVEPRGHRALPIAFGVLTLLSVGLLLTCDALPHLFPVEAHDVLAALPLVSIAGAYVVYQAVRGAPQAEYVKTALVVFAFLFWAANQLCVDRRLATIFNDVAIAAFVLDVFLAIVGWPSVRGRMSAEKTAPAASP